jgi:hypothetical protein
MMKLTGSPAVLSQGAASTIGMADAIIHQLEL